MQKLNDADAIFRGAGPAEKLYVASNIIWPEVSPPPTPESISGSVLAFNSADVSAGTVTSWPDRSPSGNDLVPHLGNGVCTSDYVTFTSSTSMWTTNYIGVSGNSARHFFMKVRTRSVGGAFMGYGANATGQLWDFWNYNPGTLIWHGHGGGFDSVSIAPAFVADVWHTVEASYDGLTFKMWMDGSGPFFGNLPTLSTASSPFQFGRGLYSPSGDFDMKHFYFYDRVLSDSERTEVLAAME